MTSMAVLISAYNAASTIETALLSLRQQTRQADEIVIVDDGSTDETILAVERASIGLPVRLIACRRVGRAAALNVGFAATQSELVAILDADDAALPGRLYLQEDRLLEQSRVGILGGAFVQLTRNPEVEVGVRALPLSDSEIRRALAFQGPFCHSCVVYRRNAVIEAGGFRTGLRSRIDQDLWIRIGSLGYEMSNLAEPLSCHVKDSSTYFGALNTTLPRTLTMLNRNLSAVRQLNLPKYLYGAAVARSAASLLPQRVMHRIAPGLTPMSWLEFTQSVGTEVANGLVAGLLALPV